MNDKMKPALIGGVVLGVLSAIPVVSAVNVCCCGWAIVGGLLATYLHVKGSTAPVSTGEGAVLGLMAGVVGAVVYAVVGIPLGLMTQNASMGAMVGMMDRISPEAGEQFRRQAEMMQNMSTGEMLAAMIPGILMIGLGLVIFATIGGLLGVPLFEKRKNGAGTPPPPPPPNFGGPGGGTYGANT